jgi:hypothetical protein
MIGISLALLAFDAVAAILQGFVLSVLWGWFVVPTFDAPVLSIPVAIGVSIIVKMLTAHRPSTEETIEEIVKRTAAHQIVVPLFALFAGWIAYNFI